MLAVRPRASSPRPRWRVAPGLCSPRIPVHLAQQLFETSIYPRLIKKLLEQIVVQNLQVQLGLASARCAFRFSELSIPSALTKQQNFLQII